MTSYFGDAQECIASQGRDSRTGDADAVECCRRSGCGVLPCGGGAPFKAGTSVDLMKSLIDVLGRDWVNGPRCYTTQKTIGAGVCTVCVSLVCVRVCVCVCVCACVCVRMCMRVGGQTHTHTHTLTHTHSLTHSHTHTHPTPHTPHTRAP